MTRLHDLFDQQGQSPWLDNIRRGWITSGELAEWVERGVRGLTSNPSIFQKAIQGSAEYDDEFTSAIQSGLDVEASYWELVTSDIGAALEILRPVYDASDGLDGYVSVEVDPGLAKLVAVKELLHEPAIATFVSELADVGVVFAWLGRIPVESGTDVLVKVVRCHQCPHAVVTGHVDP